MKRNVRKLTFGLMILLSLLLIFGCTNPQNAGEEMLVSGFVTEKNTEGEKNYVTFHIPKTPDGKTLDLKLQVNTKEEYDQFKEEDYYLLSYDKESQIITSAQQNNPLGEVIAKGVGENTGNMEGKPITAIEKFDAKDYTLLDSYEVDMDGDGDEETVALYTAAQRDADGEIMWDDGQKWLLTVQGKNQNYVLYDDYVQIGSIEFYVFTVDDEFHIATVQNATAGLKLTDYVFDKEENTFIPQTQYEASGNVNMLHISSGY